VDSILLIDYVLPKQTKHSELGGFMSETPPQDLTLREMLAKAGITQKKIAEKAKVSPAAVSLIVAGKSKSKRIEDLIREEVEKALTKKEEQAVKA
jgi:predicted transcriptional regulator